MKTADIISLHPGKQHNFEQAEQLVKHFHSVKHITSVAVSQNIVKKLSFLPLQVLKEIDKRSINPSTALNTDTYPWLEMVYKWKRLSKQSISYSFFKKLNRLFQERILKHYSPPSFFIGFDTSSDLIIEKWKGKTILILDLTIAVPQFKKKLAEDYRLPDSIINKLTKDDEIWYRTYETELALADYILCGSEFVKQSCLYLGVQKEKIKIIPYGVSLEKFTPLILPGNRENIPFKIAFIGTVGYRKGADVLLKAWEKLIKKYNFIELHFYGTVEIDTSQYSLEKVFFHGFITQQELIKDLKDAQVSILPTFFEGSSCAIYQSMALGLAVVTTVNCGSIITHMKNGLLINYGSEVEICEALVKLIEHKNITERLAKQAMEDVKDYTWDSYGVKLQAFISNLSLYAL
jgi:glycosyltransferase involved in cell wall biosynthesis